jgi:ATP:ADP antiporter, AAA family
MPPVTVLPGARCNRSEVETTRPPEREPPRGTLPAIAFASPPLVAAISCKRRPRRFDGTQPRTRRTRSGICRSLFRSEGIVNLPDNRKCLDRESFSTLESTVCVALCGVVDRPLEPALAAQPASAAAGVSAHSTSARDQWLSRLLRPFGQVEPSEAVTASILALTVFLLLTAYYLLKTAREPLILLQGGAEVKSYAAAGQSMLLLVVVRAYSSLARRVGRMALVASVYLFFAANLLLFALLAQTEVRLGVAFYLWVGIFNMTAISQFWSFANDIYDPEQGKRLFGILGIGSSVGAVAGSALAKQLAPLGPASLMLVAGGVLVVCVGLFWVVHRRAESTSHKREAEAQTTAQTRTKDNVAEGAGIRDLLQSKYMLLLGGLMFLLNCVNSNGEYLLDRTLLETVQQDGIVGSAATTFVGQFKADYFQWVNVIGVVLQLFVVSRLMQYIGVRRALFVMPIVSMLSYGTLLLFPVLSLIKLGKIAENSLDYSVQNTARQALFLVTSRAEKYVGKNIVDTLIVRLGDVMSAGLVWLAAELTLPAKALAALNLLLITAWLVVLVAINREHRRRSQQAEAEGIAA